MAVLDLQVNGYRSVDFSSAAFTPEDLRSCWLEYLNDSGPFLPTVITSSKEFYRKQLPIMAQLLDEDPYRDVVPGLHLEGPFISPEPGAVGAHNPNWVRPPDPEYLKNLQEMAKGKIRMITIAANTDGAEGLCRAATDIGIVVSLGHQLATFDDLDRLYQSGARSLTHLGNGMPNIVPRHENPLLSGLLHPNLIPILIADLHHLPLWLLKRIIQIKGCGNVIVTSDASPIAGMPPGAYHTLGNEVVLEEDGRLHNPKKGCLVGSSATLDKCRKILRDEVLCTDDEVRQMTEINPRKLLGLLS